jgi:hypothetical protein
VPGEADQLRLATVALGPLPGHHRPPPGSRCQCDRVIAPQVPAVRRTDRVGTDAALAPRAFRHGVK